MAPRSVAAGGDGCCAVTLDTRSNKVTIMEHRQPNFDSHEVTHPAWALIHFFLKNVLVNTMSRKERVPCFVWIRTDLFHLLQQYAVVPVMLHQIPGRCLIACAPDDLIQNRSTPHLWI